MQFEQLVLNNKPSAPAAENIRVKLQRLPVCLLYYIKFSNLHQNQLHTYVTLIARKLWIAGRQCTPKGYKNNPISITLPSHPRFPTAVKYNSSKN